MKKLVNNFSHHDGRKPSMAVSADAYTASGRMERGAISASDIRNDLLALGRDVVIDMLRQARGEKFNAQVPQSAKEEIFKAILPMVHQAGDTLILSNLASKTPVERADAILLAVATGVISPKQAQELVTLMKDIAVMTGAIEAGDSAKLVINLAPQSLEKLNDVTLKAATKEIVDKKR